MSKRVNTSLPRTLFVAFEDLRPQLVTELGLLRYSSFAAYVSAAVEAKLATDKYELAKAEKARRKAEEVKP